MHENLGEKYICEDVGHRKLDTESWTPEVMTEVKHTLINEQKLSSHFLVSYSN